MTISFSDSPVSDMYLLAHAMMVYLRGGRIRTAALAMKLATEDELEEMAVAWEEWTKRDDAMLSMMQGEIIIEK